MTCLLPTDCLNEIFENLEDDKITLHSCLLVNRLWCKASVRILWKDIWRFKYLVTPNRQLKVASAILSTLISCLPNESKELLHKNEIFISTPTSKQPLFNYVSFCKVLSINEIYQIIGKVLKNDKSITALSLLDRNCLVAKEILKMFMNQVSSLKTLTYLSISNTMIISYNILPFTSFPGARDCLTSLSELHCSVVICSEFFNRLSQICHNLRSLAIHFDYGGEVSNDLKELVSSQNNLKNLKLSSDGYDWADLIPALTKHSSTLTKLDLYGDYYYSPPLSFVSLFLNLQEIEFSFGGIQFEDFKKLQYITFPKLKTLKFPYGCPKHKYLMKFLEINGKNLKEFYLNDISNGISKYCPNLKKLRAFFDRNELKNIFNNCQDLESIYCNGNFWNEGELLETVAKYSPKNFYELKLHDLKLFPENLESFLISWKNRTSKKSLNLIIVDIYYNRLNVKEESMKIIEKYKNLGVIKKFEVRKKIWRK